MIPQWWWHLLKGEKITFYNLQLFGPNTSMRLTEDTEMPSSWLLRRRDLLGIRPTDSWTLVTLSGVRIVIGGPEGDEPVTLRSPQVPWVSNFLTNLKIWLLVGNLLKLNFLLNLAWTIWKDFVSLYVFTQKIFCSIDQGIIRLFFV